MEWLWRLLGLTDSEPTVRWDSFRITPEAVRDCASLLRHTNPELAHRLDRLGRPEPIARVNTDEAALTLSDLLRWLVQQSVSR
jgi:hypothetical protein